MALLDDIFQSIEPTARQRRSAERRRLVDGARTPPVPLHASARPRGAVLLPGIFRATAIIISAEGGLARPQSVEADSLFHDAWPMAKNFRDIVVRSVTVDLSSG